MALTIRWDERVIFVGKTGSGKTFLAERLSATLPRLIVVDSKGTLRGRFNTDEWGRGVDRAIRRGDDFRVRAVVQPGAPVRDYWESLFERVYYMGDVAVYIDEIYGVVPPGSQPGEWLNALYTRGREFGISMWASTQRPTWLPLFTLSENDWFFQFTLQMAADRKRMGEIIHPLVMTPIPDKHGFFYYHTSWSEPLYTSILRT
jgi:energy-coupling factor transporter ATP-binding protein EcfA2